MPIRQELSSVYWLSIGSRSMSLRKVIAAMVICATCCYAQATEPAAKPAPGVDIYRVFTFSFLMLGPIKILGPFVQMTRGADEAFRRRLAFRAFLFASAALVLAAILGVRMLHNFSIPTPVLVVAGGLILFLVALKAVLQQFEMQAPQRAEFTPTLHLALNPLAFPTIVTPYGVAAVIIFMQLSPNLSSQLEVFGALACIMGLNLLAMLFAHAVLKWAGLVLQILGTVLGIVQVALGLQFMLGGLRSLGIIVEQGK